MSAGLRGHALTPRAPNRAVPGDLLVKFAPEATLLDRYRFLAELAAESRDKLWPLGVYRVRVAEGADLDAVVQACAGDPRVRYLEPNYLVSVPEPAAADMRRE